MAYLLDAENLIRAINTDGRCTAIGFDDPPLTDHVELEHASVSARHAGKESSC